MAITLQSVIKFLQQDPSALGDALKPFLPKIRQALDLKVIATFSLIFFAAFAVQDSFITPGFKGLSQVQESIAMQRQAMQSKVQEYNALKEQEQQIKDLPASIPEVQPGESPKILALGQSDALKKLIQGDASKLFVANVSSPEYLKRELVSLTALSEGKPLELQSILLTDAGTPSNNDSAPAAAADDAANKTADNFRQTIPGWRFDYELKVHGTYAALMALINDLNALPTGILIHTVELTPSEKPLSKATIARVKAKVGMVALVKPSGPKGDTLGDKLSKDLKGQLGGLSQLAALGGAGKDAKNTLDMISQLASNSSSNTSEPNAEETQNLLKLNPNDVPLNMTLQFSWLFQDPAAPVATNGDATNNTAGSPGGGPGAMPPAIGAPSAH